MVRTGFSWVLPANPIPPAGRATAPQCGSMTGPPKERLNAVGAQAYHSAVEKLIARAEAVRPTPIKEQMAQAAREAGKENAARTAPAKKKEARDDR